MSATLLRQIIGKQFNIRPEKVILSGVIKPDATFEATTGVSYVDTYTRDLSVYSFDGKEWHKLPIVGGTHYYNGNHDQSYTTPTPLHEVCDGTEILFVEVEDGEDNGDQIYEVTVYKAPSFQLHWDKISQEDTKRWEDWVNS